MREGEGALGFCSLTFEFYLLIFQLTPVRFLPGLHHTDQHQPCAGQNTGAAALTDFLPHHVI